LNLTIRLYYKHDYDLIALYYNKNFNFKKYLRKTLIDFTYDKTEIIPLPEYQSQNSTGIPCGDVQLHIMIYDEETIKKLNQINKFQRNNFIKNLFRNRLENIYYLAYLPEEKEKKGKEKEERKKENKVTEETINETIEEVNSDYQADDDDIFGMFEHLNI